MKTCTKCKIEKGLQEFNKKSSTKDKLSNQCKLCNKENLLAHYKCNPQYYKQKAEIKRIEDRKWFTTIKEQLSCSTCGESRWWTLDFHHRDPLEKENNIGDILVRNGRNKVLEEIKKCIVLCANCHRDHHYRERNNL
jgi:hypothetical protein